MWSHWRRESSSARTEFLICRLREPLAASSFPGWADRSFWSSRRWASGDVSLPLSTWAHYREHSTVILQSPWISAQEWLSKGETSLLLQRGVWFPQEECSEMVLLIRMYVLFSHFRPKWKRCWHLSDRRAARCMYFLETTRMRICYVCFCGFTIPHLNLWKCSNVEKSWKPSHADRQDSTPITSL